ncbi:putative membrane protein YccC [Nocardioides ginsengisegetis]|uniref:Putative membrane protein YccC n=1 Tax=Nocardioides ginsengisegetis TaxID=661491 RepID=A0A7W3P8U7_9ACTN|nr:hypothetical protein [Nocardioides ginsengisegetis]MBA8803010.1 putative membrane protein YccC [Nocardioides ginsengisegetis]
MIQPLHVVGSRPAGPTAGSLLGLVAGSLVFAAWFNDHLLGIAVAGVFVGLIACVLAGAPGWERFGAALLVGTAVAASGWWVVFHLGG